ncbi:hypothetical protein JCM10213v2_002750 [Rhodosporidiobolus nylandii]
MQQGPMPDVAEQLRQMNARLESLESTLSRAIPPPQASSSLLLASQPRPGTPRLASLNPSLAAAAAAASAMPRMSTSSQNGSESSPQAGGSGLTPASTSMLEHRDDVGVNAVETAGEAMAVEGLVDLCGEARTTQVHEEHQLGAWDSVRPDVLGKSIMTLEDCDAEFDFYFEHLQPWTCLLSTTLDRHPLVVRERSPLLFHSILLLTLYYRPRTPSNIYLYRHVSSILDSILAPQILCPQEGQLSFDFVRAIHLLLMYKPLQWAALNAQGVSDPAQIESSSKMNVRASWILRLLVSRVSAFIGLPSIATTFAQAFANQHQTPIPDDVISQLRLFLACVFHESHGALQSGKAANFVPADACKVTRLFAALRRQSSDVRLAASVELVALASGALFARKEDGVLETEDLLRFDDEYAQWAEYWAPLLAVQSASSVENHAREDRAWSTFYPYASFTRLTVRGWAFTKWRAERKERAAQRAAAGGFALCGGATGALTLGAEERESIAGAVRVAEEQMLAVSEGGGALRSGRGGKEESDRIWEQAGDASLSPDAEVVRTLKWASDSLTCVMFSYPLIFLAKLANEGLLRSDLTVISAGSPPLPPSPMSPTDKLCRLFQLGADLLDAIAPNPHHPSVKQAAFLRKVWDAGISGRRSITSAPSSPKFAGDAGGGTAQIPPHISLGVAAAALAHVPSPASMPPPHPALANAHQHPPPHTALQPPTIPPPPTAAAYSGAPSAGALSQPYGVASPPDFSLSTAYNPTPMHSPPFPSHPRPQNPHQPPPQADPFAALLSGVSPSLFESGAGGSSFLNFDGAGDWPDLGSGAGTPGGTGATGGSSGFGGFGMQF